MMSEDIARGEPPAWTLSNVALKLAPGKVELDIFQLSVSVIYMDRARQSDRLNSFSEGALGNYSTYS
jgi:hypothetical protein